MENLADPGIETASAAASAYRLLEQAIVTLELAPDARTTEGELIERVGLGRTPVREAIQRLGWEGLIVVRPRAGLAIAPLVAADWLKVLDARRGVEAVLARSAAENGTAELDETWEAIQSKMEAAARDQDAPAFLRADKALDDAIDAAATNPYASRVVAPLQSHSRRFWYRFSRAAGLGASVHRHMAVIEAIQDADGRSAAKAMERLIDMLRETAREAVRAAG